MAYQIAYYIYFCSLLFACFSSLHRIKKLDKAAIPLMVLVWCALLNESIASYFARRYHNNLPIYTVYGFVEFALLSIYFNRVVDVFTKKNMGLYIGGGGLILGILNTIFLQPIDSFNTYFLLLEGLLVIGMCLFAFFRLLLKRDSLSLSKYPHFWFISILMFFWSITFLTWGLYDYINQQLQQSALTINTALFVIGTITYACFGRVFLTYPQKSNTILNG